MRQPKDNVSHLHHIEFVIMSLTALAARAQAERVRIALKSMMCQWGAEMENYKETWPYIFASVPSKSAAYLQSHEVRKRLSSPSRSSRSVTYTSQGRRIKSLKCPNVATIIILAPLRFSHFSGSGSPDFSRVCFVREIQVVVQETSRTHRSSLPVSSAQDIRAGNALLTKGTIWAI